MPRKIKQLEVTGATQRVRTAARPVFRRGSPLAVVWSFIMWLVGVVVSLAVGFGMANGVLSVMYLPSIVVETVGWIVVTLTIVGVLLKLIDKLGGN